LTIQIATDALSKISGYATGQYYRAAAALDLLLLLPQLLHAAMAYPLERWSPITGVNWAEMLRGREPEHVGLG